MNEKLSVSSVINKVKDEEALGPRSYHKFYYITSLQSYNTCITIIFLLVNALHWEMEL